MNASSSLPHDSVKLKSIIFSSSYYLILDIVILGVDGMLGSDSSNQSSPYP